MPVREIRLTTGVPLLCEAGTNSQPSAYKILGEARIWMYPDVEVPENSVIMYQAEDHRSIMTL